MKPFIYVAFAIAVAYTPALAQSVTESTIPFQGKLTSATGTALTGSYDFRFSLFTDATSSDQGWTSDHSAVTVQNGFYSVRLGSLV
ncbi:MAG: hypothetical protein NUW37_20175, partial [Planctomycetes bacterium]|nr:hypothetical protein [Planctomycetota bacterium]